MIRVLEVFASHETTKTLDFVVFFLRASEI